MAASDRDAMYQRTLREARAAAALSHPAVVQVYDVVTESGRPWIVMELLQARSLAEIIVEDGPLAPRAVAKIGIALLGALEVAHAAGVLHRDVKPANVLICADGRCVLTDFGVARMPSDSQLTTPGMVLGSPHFISPERAIGAPFGPPSDLFSLGVTLYTAVEGRPPFDRPDPIETMRAVVEEQPTPTMRAGALGNVLYGLLDKDPDRRWDVPMSRGVLRDLLASALASNAPAHQTDPYAVVRPAPYTPPTAAKEPPPTGQIGGKAMLAPGETLTGAIRRRQTTKPRTPSQRGPADPGTTDVAAALPATGAFTASANQAPAGAHQHGGYSGGNAPTQRVEYPKSTTYGSGGGRHAAGGGALVPAQRRAAAIAGAKAGLRDASGKAVQAFRGLPPKARIAVTAGAAALLVVVVASISLTGGGDGGRKPGAQATNNPQKPLIQVQEYRHPKGAAVNVPAGWLQSPPKSGDYMDFVDPQNADRWVRVNIEKTNLADGRAVLEAAARRFQSPNGGCPGYQHVQITDAKLAGLKGASFEYTCAPPNKALRHGRWTAIVANGETYQVTLSVPANDFNASKVIDDEMARSFRFNS